MMTFRYDNNDMTIMFIEVNNKQEGKWKWIIFRLLFVLLNSYNSIPRHESERTSGDVLARG